MNLNFWMVSMSCSFVGDWSGTCVWGVRTLCKNANYWASSLQSLWENNQIFDETWQWYDLRCLVYAFICFSISKRSKYFYITVVWCISLFFLLPAHELTPGYCLRQTFFDHQIFVKFRVYLIFFELWIS